MIDTLISRFVYAAGDPWMMMFGVFAIVWLFVIVGTLIFDRPKKVQPGVTNDPYFFDRVTGYHNEL